MRHKVNKRNFGRRPSQRVALLRGMADQLVQHERIETTLTRAKELRKVIEPLVTLAKKGDLHSRRQVASRLYTKESVKKLFDEMGQRFQERPGGYTRIIKSGIRRGDAAPTALIEFIPENEAPKAKKKARPNKAKAASKNVAPKQAKEAKGDKSENVTKKASSAVEKNKKAVEKKSDSE